MNGEWITKLVDELIDDMRGRSGFDQDVDEETWSEWKRDWEKMVSEAVAANMETSR